MAQSTLFTGGTVRRAAAAGILAALVAMPLTPMGAVANASSIEDEIASLLAANGGSMSDLADFAEVVDVDTAAGVETRSIVTLEEAFALLDGIRPGPVTQGPAGDHVVAGGIYHFCQHGQRRCYQYEVLQDTAPAYDDAKAFYMANLAGAAGAWPFAGSRLLDVGGDYGAPGFGFGGHAANNTNAGKPSIDTGETGLVGTGGTHSDKDVHAIGAGNLRMVIIPWGPNLVISYGRLSLHGGAVACGTSTSPECSSLADVAKAAGVDLP